MPVSNRAINRGIYICSNCGNAIDLEDGQLEVYIGEDYTNSVEFRCVKCNKNLCQANAHIRDAMVGPLTMLIDNIENVNTDEELQDMRNELNYLAKIFDIDV